MANFDFKDLYNKYVGSTKYNPNTIIEDDLLKTIVQKYEMIIFTNKGELYGDPDFGADLQMYLHETKVNATIVEDEIVRQINKYIPEIAGVGYTLTVNFAEHPEKFEDVMLIDFKLRDQDVKYLIE